MAIVFKTSQLKNIIALVQKLARDEPDVSGEEVLASFREDFVESIPGMRQILDEEQDEAKKEMMVKILQVSQKPIQWSIEKAFTEQNKDPDLIVDELVQSVATDPIFSEHQAVQDVLSSLFEASIQKILDAKKTKDPEKIQDEQVKKISSVPLSAMSLERFLHLDEETSMVLVQEIQRGYARVFAAREDESASDLTQRLFNSRAMPTAMPIYELSIGKLITELKVEIEETRPGFRAPKPKP